MNDEFLLTPTHHHQVEMWASEQPFGSNFGAVMVAMCLLGGEGIRRGMAMAYVALCEVVVALDNLSVTDCEVKLQSFVCIDNQKV